MNKYLLCKCKLDKKEAKRFYRENGIIPSPVPDVLRELTQCEKMRISRVCPIMQVYTKSLCGCLGYKGHTINLSNNDKHVAEILPHYPKVIPIVDFKM